VPLAPLTRMRSAPTRFWPKSSSVRPEGEVSTSLTGTSAAGRTGGPSGATKVPASKSVTEQGSQALSSKPGADQPGCSSRAS